MNVVDLIRELSDYHSPDSLCQTLRRRGWKRLGSGANKRVFCKPGEGCVIKVFKQRGGWYSDLSTCGIIPKNLLAYWLDNVYVCGRFTVQPRAREGWKAMRLLRKKVSQKMIWNWDIKEANVGMYLGEPVIFDYGYIGGAYDWEDPGPAKRKPTLRMKTI